MNLQKYLRNLFCSVALLAALAVLASCNKLDDIEMPVFNVFTDKEIYAAGDTVAFNFEGNPELVSFYSGEFGKDYAYVATDRVFPLKVQVSFATQAARQGNTVQEDQLQVKVSSDLDFSNSANYTDSLNALRNANWTNITADFTLCELSLGVANPYASSGVKDITSLLQPEKQFYFAFQYINRPYSTYGISNIWRVNAFSMNSTIEIGTSQLILGQVARDWTFFYIGDGWTGSGSSIGSSVITMRGVRPNNENEQELWCISKPLEVGENINLGQDLATGIKAIADPRLKKYKYVFTTPGTYIVTFVAINSNIYGKKETVKQLTITVQ